MIESFRSIHICVSCLNIDLSLNVFNPVPIVDNFQVIHGSIISAQICEQVSHTPILLNQSLKLCDVLLIELNLPFHVL